jgi:hypothetical protein
MNLTLVRRIFTPRGVIGDVSVDGAWECYGLENAARLIPEGRYRVVIDWSNRFQRTMPHILNVPDREGIRIHVANWPEELEGCIAVGRKKADDFVGESRVAFNRLYFKIADAIARGEEVWIDVGRQDSGL